jgi:hypothetical protein
LGDWFPLRTYFLTSKASPNDSEIVIVVIIGIGEAQLVLHNGGIIAQTACLDRVFLLELCWVQPAFVVSEDVKGTTNTFNFNFIA